MIDGLGTGLELPLALFLICCVAAMVCALPWRRWVLCAAVLGLLVCTATRPQQVSLDAGELAFLTAPALLVRQIDPP